MEKITSFLRSIPRKATNHAGIAVATLALALVPCASEAGIALPACNSQISAPTRLELAAEKSFADGKYLPAYSELEQAALNRVACKTHARGQAGLWNTYLAAQDYFELAFLANVVNSPAPKSVR
jgi:hypothetical protein